MKKNSENNDIVFKSMEDEEESPFLVDRVDITQEEPEENTDDKVKIRYLLKTLKDDKEKPINISKMLKDAEQELGDDYIQATYMLKYINSFTKAGQLSKEVVILFQDGGPLILHYLIEMGVITYCLSDISSAADQSRS